MTVNGYALLDGFPGVVIVNDDGAGAYIPNEMDNPYWQAYQNWIAEGNIPEAQFSPPIVVPQTVTRYQARAVLLTHDLLDQVNAYFAALPNTDLGKLAWAEAPTVYRNSEALIAAAHSLGLTDEQVDAMFIEASQVV